jgi:hypothetical protein
MSGCPSAFGGKLSCCPACAGSKVVKRLANATRAAAENRNNLAWNRSFFNYFEITSVLLSLVVSYAVLAVPPVRQKWRHPSYLQAPH